MARTFDAPVLINLALVDARSACPWRAAGSRFVVYEAGEALRFDEVAIRVGVHGGIQTRAITPEIWATPAADRRTVD